MLLKWETELSVLELRKTSNNWSDINVVPFDLRPGSSPVLQDDFFFRTRWLKFKVIAILSQCNFDVFIGLALAHWLLDSGNPVELVLWNYWLCYSLNINIYCWRNTVAKVFVSNRLLQEKKWDHLDRSDLAVSLLSSNQ